MRQLRLARKQDGIALISTLLVFSLVVILVSTTVRRDGLDIRKTMNLLHHSQAYQYALGGEALARQILHRDWEEDKVNGAADHHGESWFLESLFEPDRGKMKIVITDLHGRFNINNLIDANGRSDTHQQQILKQMLSRMSLPDNTLDAITDWLDKDSTPLGSKSEDSHFLNQTPPYRSADRPIAHESELNPATALTPESLALLNPQITALPEKTAINPNTATALLLSGLNSQLPVDQILNRRDTQPFLSDSDFLTSDTTAGVQLNADDISVRSLYFEAFITAKYQDTTVYLRSRLHRDAETGTITTLSRNLQRPPAYQQAEVW